MRASFASKRSTLRCRGYGVSLNAARIYTLLPSLYRVLMRPSTRASSSFLPPALKWERLFYLILVYSRRR